MPTPAEKLENLNLEDGWKVLEKIEYSEEHSGGNFSCSYVVQSQDGKKAFLKALDFSRAMNAPDPARELESMTTAFNFERDLLEQCKGMDRIVKAIASGMIKVEDSIAGVVQYIIFELAERDVRSQMELIDNFDTAWALRSLHHTATGLKQLHSKGFAHQDLKPSNILIFDDNTSKISDLGCASTVNGYSPRDKFNIPGDRSYAPIEQLYKHIEQDWTIRRICCDLYHLGSMVVFYFAKVNMNSLIRFELDQSFYWENWNGTYNEVVPHVLYAFECALDNFSNNITGEELRDELKLIVKQLCYPIPSKRGHPNNRLGYQNLYSLERYLTKFDILAKKAEFYLIGIV